MAKTKREAIADAQRQLGVTADGIWGPKTQAAYQRASASVQALATSKLVQADLSAPKIVAYQRGGGDANKEVFKQQVVPAVLRYAREAGLNGQIMLAQMKHETGGGGRIPPGSNNWAGIKARAGEASVVAGTTEFINGKETKVKEPFKKYASADEFARDYVGRLASSRRYSSAYREQDNEEAARKIAAAGYATDPFYAGKIAKLASTEFA